MTVIIVVVVVVVVLIVNPCIVSLGTFLGHSNYAVDNRKST